MDAEAEAPRLDRSRSRDAPGPRAPSPRRVPWPAAIVAPPPPLPAAAAELVDLCTLCRTQSNVLMHIPMDAYYSIQIPCIFHTLSNAPRPTSSQDTRAAAGARPESYQPAVAAVLPAGPRCGCEAEGVADLQALPGLWFGAYVRCAR